MALASRARRFFMGGSGRGRVSSHIAPPTSAHENRLADREAAMAGLFTCFGERLAELYSAFNCHYSLVPDLPGGSSMVEAVLPDQV